MFGRIGFARATLPLALLSALTTACGGGAGGSDASNNVPHPLVRQFSPVMSPIDFGTGQANPTFTDGELTVNTEPAYPGKICVFFQTSTKIDPKSVFIGGNPTLGIDLSALQILRYIPGTGNVPLQPAANGVEVLDDRIIFTPASLPLPDGQYSIGVFANLKSVEGDPVDKTPVFHSFTVGNADTIPPIVVVTNPIEGAVGVGAGVPPPQPPPGVTGVADVRTAIFGPTSPDIIVRFSESIASDTVNTSTMTVVDAGSHVGGGQPPPIPPAPGFPMLKSTLDGSSLPSNGFEVVWRADPTVGGLPFGTQVQVTVVGSDGGANTAPITDRSSNMLELSYQFQFQTIAPPNLPVNPEPEYAIYWSATDRFGVLDVINQKEQAAVFLGTQTTQVKRNFVPDQTDKIATKQTLGLTFDPNEISVDARTNGASCHTYAYVQSSQSGQVVIINTRTSLPAAIINTPSPGGLSNQTGGGQAANCLIVTNSSANTFTVFDLNNITTGIPFLNGPIYVTQVNPTGNSPRAIAISAPALGAFNREFLSAGPPAPLILYADFGDGVVNTANLGTLEPIRQFALGVGASPNDVSISPCIPQPPPNPPLLIAAISEGGAPGEGKVAYYVAGPRCDTGFGAGARPDSIVGDLSGFDAPAGLDDVFPFSTTAFFAVAESGSSKNQIVILGVTPGAFTFPAILKQFKTGANPVAIAHPPSYFTPLSGAAWICQLFTPGCPALGIAYTPPPCWYFGTEQFPIPGPSWDQSGDPSNNLYVCVRGAGRIEVLESQSGAHDFYSPIVIPGVRNVASTGSQ